MNALVRHETYIEDKMKEMRRKVKKMLLDDKDEIYDYSTSHLKKLMHGTKSHISLYRFNQTYPNKVRGPLAGNY